MSHYGGLIRIIWIFIGTKTEFTHILQILCLIHQKHSYNKNMVCFHVVEMFLIKLVLFVQM